MITWEVLARIISTIVTGKVSARWNVGTRDITARLGSLALPTDRLAG
jgi:hypothetical protein